MGPLFMIDDRAKGGLGLSGYIQSHVGYQWFFVIVLCAAAPSLLVTWLAPFHHPDSAGPNVEVKPGEAAPAAA